ncbi:tyrosine-type recombinase/integrase [Jatrophihabitans sp.]|uniref:site-specific integrase n=1 Tax=Jatrophihabitans sp. TaxID=1932789 RepID=UPI0030C704D7|nr:hypothetical protein [Jatrophihabitans sp.]
MGVEALRGWPGALDGYTVTLEAANRSRTTVRLHRHYLTQLRRRHPFKPWGVTTHQLRELMATPTWGPESKQSCRTVLRQFYAWGHSEQLIDVNPALALVPIVVPRTTVQQAPEYVVRHITGHPEPRMQLMGMLGSFLGLRCCEIARVHSDDLHGAARDVLHVLGKGRRERDLPVMNLELLARLHQLDGWAFPNKHGSHLSPAYVSTLLSRELDAGWTAHPLRHRAAQTAYDGTKDIAAVSAMLGHSKIETTQRYVRTGQDALRAALAVAGDVA